MKIIAKKAFRLEAPDGTTHQLTPMLFETIDDKFSKCLIFGLGQKDGDIEIIETATKQKQLENEPGLPSRGGVQQPGMTAPTKEKPPAKVKASSGKPTKEKPPAKDAPETSAGGDDKKEHPEQTGDAK